MHQSFPEHFSLSFNHATEPAAEDNLMFNGEVEHLESPKNELEEENVQTTPSKVITELEDSKPSVDTPSDLQVCHAMVCHTMVCHAMICHAMICHTISISLFYHPFYWKGMV